MELYSPYLEIYSQQHNTVWKLWKFTLTIFESTISSKEITIQFAESRFLYRVGRVNLYTFVSKNRNRIVKISAPHRVLYAEITIF